MFDFRARQFATGLVFAAFAVVAAGPSLAENARLSVSMTDGDPYDRLYLKNSGGCEIVSGSLTVDFTNSDGRIIIDTQYGGIGTKDPMPVEIETGLIAVHPVADGAQNIKIEIVVIPPGGTAIVTLDFDNNDSFWFARRVSFLSHDLRNTIARFSRGDSTVQATFQDEGWVDLDLSSDACKREETEEDVTPIS